MRYSDRGGYLSPFSLQSSSTNLLGFLGFPRKALEQDAMSSSVSGWNVQNTCEIWFSCTSNNFLPDIFFSIKLIVACDDTLFGAAKLQNSRAKRAANYMNSTFNVTQLIPRSTIHCQPKRAEEAAKYTAVSTKVVPQKRWSVRDNADWYYG